MTYVNSLVHLLIQLSVLCYCIFMDVLNKMRDYLQFMLREIIHSFILLVIYLDFPPGLDTNIFLLKIPCTLVTA